MSDDVTLHRVHGTRNKEKQLRDKEKQLHARQGKKQQLLRDEKDKMLRSKEELLMTARRDIVGDKRTVQVRQTFRASCRTRNVKSSEATADVAPHRPGN